MSFFIKLIAMLLELVIKLENVYLQISVGGNGGIWSDRCCVPTVVHSWQADSLQPLSEANFLWVPALTFILETGDCGYCEAECIFG